MSAQGAAFWPVVRAELVSKRANAARRNKPTMWAYYHDMIEGLDAWFADGSGTDAGRAGAALALSQKAERECATLPPVEAARLWALGVYARRILRAWLKDGDTTPEPAYHRVSLDWLHDRERPASANNGSDTERSRPADAGNQNPPSVARSSSTPHEEAPIAN